MQMKDIFSAIDKIGCLSITTLDGTEMHSRIIHMTGYAPDGIYFLTMDSKPFYRQLTTSGKLSACGIYPVSRAEGKNAAGQPAFVPGYTFRLTGEVEEVEQAELKTRAQNGDEFSGMFTYLLEDQERYPAIRVFRVSKGKGEIFDFDFEMEHRDHKVLRTRFSFGGATHSEPGLRITSECIACGLCEEACTFKAIIPGEPYSINGSRCDECGSCARVCPQQAIEFPPAM